MTAFTHPDPNAERYFQALEEYREHVKYSLTPVEHNKFGFPLRLRDGVYPADPDLCESTVSVFAHLKTDLRFKNVLDMGTGSGVLAIEAAYRGALVMASDINYQAVLLTEFNRAANPDIADRVFIYHSDLFDHLPKDSIRGNFDLIMANLWFPPVGDPYQEMRLQSLAVYERFLLQAPEFMRDDGTMLLTCGAMAAIDDVKALFNRIGYNPLTYSAVVTNEKHGFELEWFLFAFNKNGGPAGPAPY